MAIGNKVDDEGLEEQVSLWNIWYKHLVCSRMRQRRNPREVSETPIKTPGEIIAFARFIAIT